MGNLFDHVRKACKDVAAKATRVVINYDHIPSYAASLPVDKVIQPELNPGCHYLGKEDKTVAFLLTLNAINFGSGYFPQLVKRPGLSGYFSIASSLNDVYKNQGGLSAADLDRMTVAKCTRIFGQDPTNQVIRELMQYFSKSLNDLGRYVLDFFNGSFTNLVESAESSAARLVQFLKQMPYFNDVSLYKGNQVPFFKRGQITAADLSIAFKRQRWGTFKDLDQLTIFADNLVPHVLRMDGILIYEESLLEQIMAAKLIPSGSVEEVEIRACALHAVELIKHEIRATKGQIINSSDLDSFLWNRGQHAHYKAVLRHRTRCIFY
jgi:hypothetical protein